MEKKVKKKLLSVGSLAIIGGSALVVVACGNDKDDKVDMGMELKKVNATVQTEVAHNATGSSFAGKKEGADVKAEFEALDVIKGTASSYKVGESDFLNAEFSKGVMLKSVTVKSVYDAVAKSIALNVVIEGDGRTSTKEVTIKFGQISLQPELGKIVTELSIAKAVDFASGVSGSTEMLSSLKASDTDVKSKFLPIEEFKSSGKSDKLLTSALDNTSGAAVSIAKIHVKKAYDMATRKMTIAVMLQREDVMDYDGVKAGTYVKEVVLTFAEGADMTEELEKVKAEITLDDADATSVKTWTTEDADVTSEYNNLGNDRLTKDATLGSGVTLTAKVKSAYTDSKVTLVVSVNKDEAAGLKLGSYSKDVVITVSASE